MAIAALPEHLITRFRAASFERLERIDVAWRALREGTARPAMDAELFRDLHTLKGDARIIGFHEITALCEGLEDLLALARERHFRVSDDVDVVVTMATQFVGMLLRKKAGASKASGIDIDGFLTQLREVLAESRRRSVAPAPPTPSSPHFRGVGAISRVPLGARQRLAVIATTVYLEHLRVPGESATRLRDAWSALLNEIASVEAVPLASIMDRHAAAAAEIAAELGKRVDVQLAVGDVRVGSEALEAVNTAIIHTIRNALDHGIESPAVRRERGKSASATLRVDAHDTGDGIELGIADDGAGVDLDAVRRRALAAGLLTDVEAAAASRAELLELLFHPGFSTREAPSTVSGRGIGLDAVRNAIERAGGRVTLDTGEGTGTRVVIRVPRAHPMIDVLHVAASGASPAICVPASWEATVVAGALAGALSAVRLLELTAPASTASSTLLLRRGDDHVRLLVDGAPTRASATRPCPTPPDSAVEIVLIAGAEALLLRPEALRLLATRATT